MKAKEGDDDEDVHINKLNRGSSQGHLSASTSPPLKHSKPIKSARKPAFLSGEHSALIPNDQITNNNSAKGSLGGLPPFKKTVFARHKYFNSNVPSASKNALHSSYKQPGFDIPVEDFGVESIKPI